MAASNPNNSDLTYRPKPGEDQDATESTSIPGSTSLILPFRSQGPAPASIPVLVPQLTDPRLHALTVGFETLEVTGIPTSIVFNTALLRTDDEDIYACGLKVDVTNVKELADFWKLLKQQHWHHFSRTTEENTVKPGIFSFTLSYSGEKAQFTESFASGEAGYSTFTLGSKKYREFLYHCVLLAQSLVAGKIKEHANAIGDYDFRKKTTSLAEQDKLVKPQVSPVVVEAEVEIHFWRNAAVQRKRTGKPERPMDEEMGGAEDVQGGF